MGSGSEDEKYTGPVPERWLTTEDEEETTTPPTSTKPRRPPLRLRPVKGIRVRVGGKTYTKPPYFEAFWPPGENFTFLNELLDLITDNPLLQTRFMSHYKRMGLDDLNPICFSGLNSYIDLFADGDHNRAWEFIVYGVAMNGTLRSKYNRITHKSSSDAGEVRPTILRRSDGRRRRADGGDDGVHDDIYSHDSHQHRRRDDHRHHRHDNRRDSPRVGRSRR